MSPWTAKPIATSIGGYSSFSLERACHHTRPPWDESTNLLAMASSMQAIGLLTSGLQNKSIQRKELYPTVLSCLLWGDQWSGKKLLFHCDNQAVVDIWASGSSQDPLTMHLVCSIFFKAATNHFTVLVTHIVSTNNTFADSLSRLQITPFSHLWPATDPDPTPVPRQHQPFGKPSSLPPISGHCRLNPSLLPGWHSEILWLLCLQRMAKFPGHLDHTTLLCPLLGWPRLLQDHKVIHGRPLFYIH